MSDTKAKIKTIRMNYRRPVNWTEPTCAWVLKDSAGWVSRLLWDVLHAMGAIDRYREERATYKNVEINGDKVMALLRSSFGRCFPDHVPTQIYMGPRQLDELVLETGRMFDKQLHHTISFDGGMNYYIASGKAEYRDCPITVVPHMDGVLVI